VAWWRGGVHRLSDGDLGSPDSGIPFTAHSSKLKVRVSAKPKKAFSLPLCEDFRRQGLGEQLMANDDEALGTSFFWLPAGDLERRESKDWLAGST